MKIKIIGFGVVGKNIKKIFKNAHVHDNFLNYIHPGKTDIAFICVPTPMATDGSCDFSIVKKVILEHEAEIYVIKSTIPPGTTEALIKETGKNIIFSPEYYGETVHANAVDYNFVILGGDRQLTKKVAEVYKKESHSSLKIFQTDSKTAELCKYMENSFLATKVTFCNEFFRIANKIGVDYNELRELFLCDPRVNRSHTFVYEDQPYYDSKCLNKDIPAIINFSKTKGHFPSLLVEVRTTNDAYKKEFESKNK